MNTRNRMFELMASEEVDAFLERFPTSAIFKAGGCHKTMQGFGIVETALANRELHLGFIKVIENRPASNRVAELADIQHESPQFILFVDGKPVFDLDNWEITAEALNPALEKFFGAAMGEESEAPKSEMGIYRNLLKQFTSGALDERKFRSQWLSTFQMDGSPRSEKEISLLKSIYGDPDGAELPPAGSPLERAQQLLSVI